LFPASRGLRPEEVKTSQRYRFIKEHIGKWYVNEMCTVLEVTESGYYRWLKMLAMPKRDELLLVEIRHILNSHPDNDNYGTPRMQLALKQNGHAAGLREIKLLCAKTAGCTRKSVVRTA